MPISRPPQVSRILSVPSALSESFPHIFKTPQLAPTGQFQRLLPTVGSHPKLGLSPLLRTSRPPSQVQVRLHAQRHDKPRIPDPAHGGPSRQRSGQVAEAEKRRGAQEAVWVRGGLFRECPDAGSVHVRAPRAHVAREALEACAWRHQAPNRPRSRTPPSTAGWREKETATGLGAPHLSRRHRSSARLRLLRRGHSSASSASS